MTRPSAPPALQTFTTTLGGLVEVSIRAFRRGEECWFVAKDVTDALGYANGPDAVAKHVDADQKGTIAFRDGAGGPPRITVTEGGLYALVMGSKLPQARMFRRWVLDTVLPSLRKHGGYVMGPCRRGITSVSGPCFEAPNEAAPRFRRHATECSGSIYALSTTRGTDPDDTDAGSASRTSTFDFNALIDGQSRTFPVRVVTLEGNPWFVGSDVRSALGIAGHGKVYSPLADDEVRVFNRRGSTSLVGFPWGRTHHVALLSESGLYKLIMRSDKPQAHPFQDWVTREVLPSIRKTGAYELPKGEVMPRATCTEACRFNTITI